MNSKFITNKGTRKSNQDVVFIKNLDEDNKVFLLADGMGGYKNGGYAANFIVVHLYQGLNTIENFDADSIQAEVDKVTKALALENEKQESKMGATLGGVIQDNGDLHCFWIGDVKIWHIKNGQIGFESIEHNLKNELIENKVFVEANSAKKYNHIVTRAIQNDIKKAKIDYKRIEDFEQGDYIILASDGVTDVLSNNQLLDIINSEKKELNKLSEINDFLLKRALDNFSLIMIF
ncbi:serine/threonine protein phosphatase [Yeosuana aromativorans]|uniref:Serine/threonine protein phosphatase n=1 Tax=Yeosuana aromativorans TaxID=288019 RepID=A0A8J3FJQ2_9FLAO|nr:PP2C family protein-serine/threonine phosphatase [Yeosuana aromativorans]GGK34419.1 serine/threonine protein phosphatase [Yeosuana aromativorans]